MKEKQIKESLENIQYLALDINIKEISAHVENENMSQWISAWRREMNEQINNIKEAIK